MVTVTKWLIAAVRLRFITDIISRTSQTNHYCNHSLLTVNTHLTTNS